MYKRQEYYNIIAQYSEKTTSSVQSNLKGTLQLYTNPSFSISLLPYYTRMFLNLYPNVKVSILSGTIPYICNQLHQAKIEKPNESILGIANIPLYENMMLIDQMCIRDRPTIVALPQS